jgi:hypothetical protein
MNNVIPFPQTFTVTVIHDPDDGMWIAVCDEIGVVTEAETYESLTWRVWEIAPELAVANGFNVTEETMRLNFQHTETVADRIAL